MTEKEEIILDIIIKYYKANRTMPSIRYLQKELCYKSTNSVYRYLLSLEKQNYLIRNTSKKLILNKDIQENYKKGLKIIEIINDKRQIRLWLDKNKKYYGFIIKNNDFEKEMIKKNDLLIIEVNSKIKNNELGLFLIKGKYRIMKFFYKDGFYILNDYEELILNKVKYIGKVIILKRNI